VIITKKEFDAIKKAKKEEEFWLALDLA